MGGTMLHPYQPHEEGQRARSSLGDGPAAADGLRSQASVLGTMARHRRHEQAAISVSDPVSSANSPPTKEKKAHHRCRAAWPEPLSHRSKNAKYAGPCCPCTDS